MRVVSYDLVPIKKMLLPGNWKQLLDDPEVAKRALSIHNLGIIHDPLVRASDWKLICGRRRVAAKAKLGDESVMCKIVECTDVECELLEAAENAEREHSPEKQRALTAQIVELMAKAEQGKNALLPMSGSGRRKTAKGIAREKLAAERGVTPEAIRQQERRWTERQREEKKAKEAPAPPEAPKEPLITSEAIDSLGMDIDIGYLSRVVELQKYLDGSSSRMQQVLGLLTTAMKANVPRHDGRLVQVQDMLRQAAETLRGLRPTMICPMCKGLDKVAPECATCVGTCYITKSQVDQIPPEFLRIENPVVLYRGETLQMDILLAAQVTEPAKEEPPAEDDIWNL